MDFFRSLHGVKLSRNIRSLFVELNNLSSIDRYHHRLSTLTLEQLAGEMPAFLCFPVFSVVIFEWGQQGVLWENAGITNGTIARWDTGNSVAVTATLPTGFKVKPE
jgi:hypothetical protein